MFISRLTESTSTYAAIISRTLQPSIKPSLTTPKMVKVAGFVTVSSLSCQTTKLLIATEAIRCARVVLQIDP